MIFGSVCSGVEAASVAWKALGWKAAFFSEIEKFPCQVLKHRYPDVPNEGDMTKFQEWKEYAIRLLCGGTPCQSFSIAGLRKGLDDIRGNLMLTFAEMAARFRPQWIFWENVPGVLSSNGGRDFAAFLGLISGQTVSVPKGGWGKSGIIPGYKNAYGIAYRVFDAQYFGVAQRRRRVFVVGYIGDWRPAAAVLLERESLQGHPAPRRKTGEKIAPCVTNGPPFSRTGNERVEAEAMVATYRWQNDNDGIVQDDISSTLRASGGTDERKVGAMVSWPAQVAPTLDAHYGDKMGLENQHINSGGGYSSIARCLTTNNQRLDAETETLIPCHGGIFDVAHTLKGEGYDASEDGTGRQNLVPMAFQSRASSSNSMNPSNISPTMDAGKAEGIAVCAAFKAGQGARAGGIGYEEEQAPTLTASDSGTQQSPSLLHGMAVRRLTPTECERLQGFPDGYTDVPDEKGKPAADGPRYKALGNSWAVPNVAWIGARIQMVDEIMRGNA